MRTPVMAYSWCALQHIAKINTKCENAAYAEYRKALVGSLLGFAASVRRPQRYRTLIVLMRATQYILAPIVYLGVWASHEQKEERQRLIVLYTTLVRAIAIVKHQRRAVLRVIKRFRLH